jgi:hypothetical protein
LSVVCIWRDDRTDSHLSVGESRWSYFKTSPQWRNRPSDERFTSLIDMQEHFDRIRAESRQMVSTTRRIEARPAGEDNDGMELIVDKLDELALVLAHGPPHLVQRCCAIR